MAPNPPAESPPIDLAEVARLEEARQARGVATVANEVLPLAGGFVCFAGVGSWANQAMGLGMDGPVPAEAIDRLIGFHEMRGVEPRIEVCPFADPSLIKGLSERGFVVRDFENVLFLDLKRTSLPPMPADPPVVRLDTSDPDAVEAAVAIAMAGFGTEEPEVFARMHQRVMRAPGCETFMAVIDGRPVAVGSCELVPPAAALFAATTLEPYRRRGCQQALMVARLRAVAEAGCRYVCVQSNPLVATGRNALRLGFQVAYTKVILVRPGPGLVPSP